MAYVPGPRKFWFNQEILDYANPSLCSSD